MTKTKTHAVDTRVERTHWDGWTETGTVVRVDGFGHHVRWDGSPHVDEDTYSYDELTTVKS